MDAVNNYEYQIYVRLFLNFLYIIDGVKRESREGKEVDYLALMIDVCDALDPNGIDASKFHENIRQIALLKGDIQLNL